MKCPNCDDEMTQGFAMIVTGSAIRWYGQDEKQHKILGVLGRELIEVSPLVNHYSQLTDVSTAMASS
ncbi:MAG: hypothetical protein ABR879_06795 [Methanomassiliicoccales archaeon]|jgi:hypothetical protein